MRRVDEEIKMLFELAYYPVMQKNQRLNGKDFIETAVLIMDECRRQNLSKEQLESAAYTMVQTFNEMLNPKMTEKDIEGMTNLLVNNNPIIRAQIEANRGK